MAAPDDVQSGRTTGSAPTMRTWVSVVRFWLAAMRYEAARSIARHELFISRSSSLIWMRCLGLNGSDG